MDRPVKVLVSHRLCNTNLPVERMHSLALPAVGIIYLPQAVPKGKNYFSVHLFMAVPVGIYTYWHDGDT